MKILPFIIICGIFLIVVPFIVKGVIIPDPLGEKTFIEVLNAIATLVVAIGLGVGVIMIIWAAILYMTAGGSEEKITKARKAIMWTIVGIAILLSAKFIIQLLEEIFKSS